MKRLSKWSAGPFLLLILLVVTFAFKIKSTKLYWFDCNTNAYLGYFSTENDFINDFPTYNLSISPSPNCFADGYTAITSNYSPAGTYVETLYKHP